MIEKQWQDWSRQITTLCDEGLKASDDLFDHERYTLAKQIAREMATLPAEHSPIPMTEWPVTPKLDVRGFVVRNGEDGLEILLVQEVFDEMRWTVPGGFVDLQESAELAIEREVLEESGFVVAPVKLLAVLDRANILDIPNYHRAIFLLDFLCELKGGRATGSVETGLVKWFSADNLPELSRGRVQENRIQAAFEHFENCMLATKFD